MCLSAGDFSTRTFWGSAMAGTGVYLSGFPRAMPRTGWQTARRVGVALFLAAGGMIVAPPPSEAAPVAPGRGIFAGPSVTRIREYCGYGFYRESKQRTK